MSAGTVRVLSYNVRSLRDDPAAVTRVLRALEPDAACLQEVPRFWGWRGKRQRLAGGCGMAVAAGRRPAGLAVLAGPRVRVLHREHHLLTPVPGLHRRGLAVAVLDVGSGRRLIAASTHLDLVDKPRRAHTAEVLTLLERARRRHDAPVVLTGDINEEPGGASWNLLTGAFQDAYAVAPKGEEIPFSARAPRKRIDGVFADPGVEVVSCGVPDDPEVTADYAAATDHRPVLAELRV